MSAAEIDNDKHQCLYSVRPKDVLEDPELSAYLSQLFPGSMVVLGDLQPAIIHHTTSAAVLRGPAGIEGLAVRFEGFSTTVISACAKDAAQVRKLAYALKSNEIGSYLVVCPAYDNVFESLNGLSIDHDFWMARDLTSENSILTIDDSFNPKTLSDFYRAVDMPFFHRDLLNLGLWSVITSGEQVISAAGLGFVVPSEKYAHIANVATLPDFQCHGLATQVIDKLCSRLARAQFKICGLFCNSLDQRLVNFYKKRGFQVKTDFKTITTLLN